MDVLYNDRYKGMRGESEILNDLTRRGVEDMFLDSFLMTALHSYGIWDPYIFL